MQWVGTGCGGDGNGRVAAGNGEGELKLLLSYSNRLHHFTDPHLLSGEEKPARYGETRIKSSHISSSKTRRMA